MRSFRFFPVAALFIALITCALVYTSCKNKCGSTTCQNGGTCDNNACICPVGYSGNSCQTGWADASIGTYTCVRSACSPAVSGINTWQSSITKDATNGGYTVDISNFNNSNTTVVATVDTAAANGSQLITISGATGTGSGTNARGSLTILNGVKTSSLQFVTYGGGITGSTCEMTMRKE